MGDELHKHRVGAGGWDLFGCGALGLQGYEWWHGHSGVRLTVGFGDLKGLFL